MKKISKVAITFWGTESYAEFLSEWYERLEEYFVWLFAMKLNCFREPRAIFSIRILKKMY